MNHIITRIKHYLKRLPFKTHITQHVDPHYVLDATHYALSHDQISQNALTVLQSLMEANYEAYIVGGGIRDLLLHHQPKDFDVATNATPYEIKKLFRYARIIGRRFKLVHVWFHRDIIEVATFRAHNVDHEHQQTNLHGMLIQDNVYGNLLDDVLRRDFTINAIYYAPYTNLSIDITGGVSDIQNKCIRIIGDPTVRYQEDPVRILRAIRFAAKLDFKIAPETEAPIYTLAHFIRHVSASRLFDEVVKLYQCGQGLQAHHLLIKYHLFVHLFPQTYGLFTSPYPIEKLIELTLKSTDSRIQEKKSVTPAFLFAILLWFPLQAYLQHLQDNFRLPFMQALEKAMSFVLSEQHKIIIIPRHYAHAIREIWILQYRLHKRLGGRAQHLLTHLRFRAAYDMLALRALVYDAPIELADWWTQFQTLDDKGKEHMINVLIEKKPLKKSQKTCNSPHHPKHSEG